MSVLPRLSAQLLLSQQSLFFASLLYFLNHGKIVNEFFVYLNCFITKTMSKCMDGMNETIPLTSFRDVSLACLL